MNKPEVLIVGGGLAGLACAMHLQKSGVSFQILEASERVGGRVRTDVIDGFRLDRGFQVLLTAYPEAQKILDYDRLQLHKFDPGALIYDGGKFRHFVDPWRRPKFLLSMAFSPVGSISSSNHLRRTGTVTLQSSADVPAIAGKRK